MLCFSYAQLLELVAWKIIAAGPNVTPALSLVRSSIRERSTSASPVSSPMISGELLWGVVVETEAYSQEEPACRRS